MKTKLVLAAAVVVLVTFSYHEAHSIVAQRIAVLRGSNRMPAEEIYQRTHFPPDGFDNIIRNVGSAIGYGYLLHRDFYSPQILERFFAAGSAGTNLKHDGQDISVTWTPINGIVPDAASQYGPQTLTFQGAYHQSIIGRVKCWGLFELPQDNPIKFTDLVGTLGYHFTTLETRWVHNGPLPATGLFGNETIVYDLSRGLYKATITARFYPNGSLAELSFHDESK
jgi:hypothetical protein